MSLFGKKKPAAVLSTTGVPTDLVIQMRQQGLSNDQVIQNLQSQGYTSSQVFDAMNQADVKGAVEAAPAGPEIPTPEVLPVGPPPASPEAPYPAPSESPMPAGPLPTAALESERERVEEVA